jgi:Domain of unknown function (DUF4349)
MSSPDLIAPDRVEELLGGAVPEGEHEALVQGLVRELRLGGAPAPASLRTRVTALGDEPPRRRASLPRRRLALALALVLVAVAGIGAGLALRGAPSGGDNSALVAPASDAPDAGGDAAPSPAPSPGMPTNPEVSGEGSVFAYDGSGRERTVLGKQPQSGPELVGDGETFDANRATDVDLLVELRLRDADELADAAGAAMAITRELGGWVAGSDVDSQGREGEAELQLRVPVARVEDAVVRLSELGTVTGQRMETVDLQAGIDARDRRLEELDRSIRIGQLRLESETLDPEERLRIQIRLEQQRAARADLLRANTRDRREAATSELTLLLHTREASTGDERDEGGAAGTARDALRLLGDIGVVALFLAIVLGPVVLLVVLLWLALRSRSRRIETRLLDRPEPAGPPSK